MLKRNIAIVIASGLLTAQVGFAFADRGSFPMSAEEHPSNLSPAQLKYLEQRAADIQKEPVTRRPVLGLPGASYSPSGLSIPGVPGQGTITGGFFPSRMPEVTKYLQQRDAEIRKEGQVLRGDSFPSSFPSSAAGGG